MARMIREELEELTLRWTYRYEMRQPPRAERVRAARRVQRYAARRRPTPRSRSGSRVARWAGDDGRADRRPGHGSGCRGRGRRGKDRRRSPRPHAAVPSITGSEEAIWGTRSATSFRAIGLGAEAVRRTRWPSRRTQTSRGPRCRGRTLPVVDRADRPRRAGRRLLLVGRCRCRAARGARRRGGVVRGQGPGPTTGRIYGRGACDMKGGVVSILAAVRALGCERTTRRPP